MMPEIEAPEKRKRGRYAFVACNQCKKRKIKCNTQQPCERCDKQGLECVYDDGGFLGSEEYKRMNDQIERLTRKVEQMESLMNGLIVKLNPQNGQSMRGNAIPEQPREEALSMTGDGLDVEMSRVDECFDSHSSEARDQRQAGPLTQPSGAANLPQDGRQVAWTGPDIDIGNGANVSECAETGNHLPAHTRWQATDVDDNENIDPLVTLDRATVTHLRSTYETQIQPLYPFLDLRSLDDHFERLLGTHEHVRRPLFQEASLDALSTVFPQVKADGIDSLICRMALAVAAYASEGQSILADNLHTMVQRALDRQGSPPGYTIRQPVISGEDLLPWQTNVKGLRLRLLTSLWEFQHGHANAAWESARQVLLVHRTLTAEATQARHDKETSDLETMYPVYWRWNMFIKSVPRFDSALEQTPPQCHNDSDEAEEYQDLGTHDPLFEHAKLCSVTCFGFETSNDGLSVLEDSRPNWRRPTAIDHVNAWQISFPTGLRSLACINPAFLASKSEQEQLVHSVMYLHAHLLRLTIVSYKYPSNGIPKTYKGPIAELIDSVKHAQESVEVLWYLHQAGKAWLTHKCMYNYFLYHVGAWIYDRLQDRTVEPTDHVVVSMQKTLTLMETYYEGWQHERAQTILRKLQDSRRYGSLV